MSKKKIIERVYESKEKGGPEEERAFGKKENLGCCLQL